MDSNAALNRLLHILSRSLPMYLEQARPWSDDDQQHVRTTLDRLLADQRLFAGRVAQAIRARRQRPDPGPFPTRFAAVNDVALDYLLRRLIDAQRDDVHAIQQCVEELADAPEVGLAEEVLGNARGHLDNLQGLIAG
jgi:hypothetical protein